MQTLMTNRVMMTYDKKEANPMQSSPRILERSDMRVYKKKFGRKEDEKSMNSPLYRYEACTETTSRLKHHCKTQDAACGIRIDVQIRVYAVIILGY